MQLADVEYYYYNYLLLSSENNRTRRSAAKQANDEERRRRLVLAFLRGIIFVTMKVTPTGSLCFMHWGWS